LGEGVSNPLVEQLRKQFENQPMLNRSASAPINGDLNIRIQFWANVGGNLNSINPTKDEHVWLRQFVHNELRKQYERHSDLIQSVIAPIDNVLIRDSELDARGGVSLRFEVAKGDSDVVLFDLSFSPSRSKPNLNYSFAMNIPVHCSIANRQPDIQIDAMVVEEGLAGSGMTFDQFCLDPHSGKSLVPNLSAHGGSILSSFTNSSNSEQFVWI
jgi:hypothetical protein